MSNQGAAYFISENLESTREALSCHERIHIIHGTSLDLAQGNGGAKLTAGLQYPSDIWGGGKFAGFARMKGVAMASSFNKDISQKYCPRFGQLAVDMGFITESQLKGALSLQIDEELSGRGHRLLGTILFDKEWMTSDQIEEVLNVLLRNMRETEG